MSLHNKIDPGALLAGVLPGSLTQLWKTLLQWHNTQALEVEFNPPKIRQMGPPFEEIKDHHLPAKEKQRKNDENPWRLKGMFTLNHWKNYTSLQNCSALLGILNFKKSPDVFFQQKAPETYKIGIFQGRALHHFRGVFTPPLPDVRVTFNFWWLIHLWKFTWFI